jgi:hypothetical protein
VAVRSIHRSLRSFTASHEDTAWCWGWWGHRRAFLKGEMMAWVSAHGNYLIAKGQSIMTVRIAEQERSHNCSRSVTLSIILALSFC